MCLTESVLNLLDKARKIAWKSFSMLVCHTTGSCLFRLPGIITIDKSFLPLKIQNQPTKKMYWKKKSTFKYTENDNYKVYNIIPCYLTGIFSPKTGGGEKNPNLESSCEENPFYVKLNGVVAFKNLMVLLYLCLVVKARSCNVSDLIQFLPKGIRAFLPSKCFLSLTMLFLGYCPLIPTIDAIAVCVK